MPARARSHPEEANGEPRRPNFASPPSAIPDDRWDRRIFAGIAKRGRAIAVRVVARPSQPSNCQLTFLGAGQIRAELAIRHLAKVPLKVSLPLFTGQIAISYLAGTSLP